jgi:hypothetical protein
MLETTSNRGGKPNMHFAIEERDDAKMHALFHRMHLQQLCHSTRPRHQPLASQPVLAILGVA